MTSDEAQTADTLVRLAEPVPATTVNSSMFCFGDGSLSNMAKTTYTLTQDEFDAALALTNLASSTVESSKITELREENKTLKKEIKELISKNKTLQVKVTYYKRKAEISTRSLSDKTSFLKKIEEQFGITYEVLDLLSNSSSSLPVDFFKSYCKHLSHVPVKQYSGEIRQFALTLQLCSLKAYRYHKPSLENLRLFH